MESAPVLTKSLVRPQRGYTLIELLVVLAIIAIITAIAVTGQSQFNRSLILTDTTYGVAFSAREAQSFGLSSRGFNGTTNIGYGLHFSSATPTQYIFFADTDGSYKTANIGCPFGLANTPSAKLGDCIFKSDANPTEVANTYTFGRGIKIQKFCAVNNGGPLVCSPALTTLDIVFTRPNTTTTISGMYGSLTGFTCAEITLTDAEGLVQKKVRISQFGEIAVNQSCPHT